MKWITRERAKVDRIACPWLISRFHRSHPGVPLCAGRPVLAEAERRGATPYDIADVELGHQGPLCSFDALMEKYGLQGKTRPSTAWPSSCAGPTRRRRTSHPSRAGSMPLPGGSRRWRSATTRSSNGSSPSMTRSMSTAAAHGPCPHPPLASDFKGSDAVEQVPVSDQGRGTCAETEAESFGICRAAPAGASGSRVFGGRRGWDTRGRHPEF